MANVHLMLHSSQNGIIELIVCILLVRCNTFIQVMQPRHPEHLLPLKRDFSLTDVLLSSHSSCQSL